jgi:hypothetical protein
MKNLFSLIVIALISSGCVTAPLEHYTVNQSLSMTDMRYQEVMNALATVAANPGILPSYSLTAGGVANVTASVSLQSTTDWGRVPGNFGSQVFSVAGGHTPDLNWALDPVAEPMLLAGAWYACRWAIWGPPAEGTPEYEREYNLLRSPTPMDIVGCKPADPAGTKLKYHLGVLDQNKSIPSGWLCVGDHCPPHGTCYQAHCGDTYVWVMPEGLHDLSEFTLVMLDIATIDTTWLAQEKLQATVAVELNLPGAKDPKSIITETWSACQMLMPDGSTKIVVRPFAEPAAIATTAPTRYSVSRAIDNSTLDLYGSETLAQAQAKVRTAEVEASQATDRAAKLRALRTYGSTLEKEQAKQEQNTADYKENLAKGKLRAAQNALSQQQQMLEEAPPQTDTPLPPPPFGAAPTVHTP